MEEKNHALEEKVKTLEIKLTDEVAAQDAADAIMQQQGDEIKKWRGAAEKSDVMCQAWRKGHELLEQENHDLRVSLIQLRQENNILLVDNKLLRTTVSSNHFTLFAPKEKTVRLERVQSTTQGLNNLFSPPSCKLTASEESSISDASSMKPPG